MQNPQNILHDLRATYRTIASDFSQTRGRYWPEFKALSEQIPDGAKILDLGCGNGRFYGYLKDEGKRVDYTGVDFCPELLAIARKKYPQQAFVEQDITALHLNERFGRVACIAAFHHIPSKKLREQTLRRIFNHLEEDGLLLISVWNLWQWRYAGAFLRSFFQFFSSLFRSEVRDLYIPFGRKKMMRYYHAFLPFELKKLLRKNGFLIERSEISRHNFVFVCRKNILSAPANPLFVDEKVFAPNLAKSSAPAMFGKFFWKNRSPFLAAGVMASLLHDSLSAARTPGGGPR